MTIFCLMELKKSTFSIDHSQEIFISCHQLLDSLITNKSHLYLMFIKIHVSTLENKSVFLKKKIFLEN